MTTFADSETRLRRFLRDPDGLIWSSADLMTYFNDAQVELAMKTGLLVRVENHYYPPQYDYSYTFDWEREYVEGTGYQMFMVNQASGDVITYPWEAGYYLSTQQTEDEDYRYMHPWESHYVSDAETPAVPLHARFDKMLFIAYDENEILPISKKELETGDPFYKDRVGVVTHYWRPDDYSNVLFPYPKPSSIVEQETTEDEIFDYKVSQGTWNFRSNLEDVSGKNYTLAWEGGGSPSYTTGLLPGTTAVILDGTTHYLTYVDIPDLDMGTVDFTLEIVFKRSLLSTSQWLLNKWAVTPSMGYAISFLTTNFLRFRMADSSGETIYDTALKVDDTANYHYLGISVDRDGLVTFCLDGVIETAAAARPGSLDNDAVFTIGRYSPSALYFFTGDIDLVRVYKGLVMTEAEMTANYAGFLTGEDIELQIDGSVITSSEEWLDEADIGIVTDIIDCEDAFIMVYQAQPNEIASLTDESDYQNWMVKYVEYGALERAFGAATDGFIPTLRDYWKGRKDIGIKALKRFQRMMLTDRDFRLGGQTRTTTSRRLRLPDGYPAV